MMKNIRFLTTVKHIKALGDIEIADVFHHPVHAKNTKFNPYIYILYYQTHLLNYLPPKPASHPN